MITSGFWGLLAAARSGDDEAVRVLCRATHPHLVRYLHVVAADRVDELAVATWSHVIRELPRFRGDEAQWRVLVLSTARRRARRFGRGALGARAGAHTLAEEVTQTAL